MHQVPKGAALAAPSLTPPAAPIVAVVGPTASGKTRLALELARRLDGEVLSADRGQLYRELDAGTDKPRGRRGQDGVLRVEGVPYHLVDLLDPCEASDAGNFARAARPVLEDALRRGKRPILAGGTGLYVRALLDGLDPLPPRDGALRRRLEERLAAEGGAALHAELSRRDPPAAARIPAANAQRLLRALEVVESTGRPISEQWSSPRRTVPALYLGIAWEPAALRGRIRRRAEAMFPAMVAEVRELVPARYSGAEPGFLSLGYPEALACAAGRMAPADGLAGMLRSTWAYARRQRTWFRNQTPVRWLAPGTDLGPLAAELR